MKIRAPIIPPTRSVLWHLPGGTGIRGDWREMDPSNSQAIADQWAQPLSRHCRQHSGGKCQHIVGTVEEAGGSWIGRAGVLFRSSTAGKICSDRQGHDAQTGVLLDPRLGQSEFVIHSDGSYADLVSVHELQNIKITTLAACLLCAINRKAPH